MPLDNDKHALCAERVFDGRRWHERAAVILAADRIEDLCSQADLGSCYPVHQLPEGASLAPGLVDLQINGGGGVLLNDDPSSASMRAVARAHQALGTCALLPTLITDTREKIHAAISAARECVGENGILGLHLEGPFINPVRAGVHPPEYISRARLDDLEWLQPLGKIGHSLVTLAPECVPEGFIRGLVEAGIRVAAGHSEASADVISRAVSEGLTGVTHLFNAMPPLKGREPGLVGSALAESRLFAGIIVDGLHVNPVSVQAAFAAKGSERMMLVSDAMPTVGGETNAFELAGRRIELRDGRLLTEDGMLAGAHLDLASAVRNAVTLCGVPLEDALRTASATPARFLGLEQDYGFIAIGARANLVVVGPELRVSAYRNARC